MHCHALGAMPAPCFVQYLMTARVPLDVVPFLADVYHGSISLPPRSHTGQPYSISVPVFVISAATTCIRAPHLHHGRLPPASVSEATKPHAGQDILSYPNSFKLSTIAIGSSVSGSLQCGQSGGAFSKGRIRFLLSVVSPSLDVLHVP